MTRDNDIFNRFVGSFLSEFKTMIRGKARSYRMGAYSSFDEGFIDVWKTAIQWQKCKVARDKVFYFERLQTTSITFVRDEIRRIFRTQMKEYFDDELRHLEEAGGSIPVFFLSHPDSPPTPESIEKKMSSEGYVKNLRNVNEDLLSPNPETRKIAQELFNLRKKKNLK